ncbi:hypothetical protein JTE90_021844 [Oedothorax gibbosus]|uniref:Ubiquitin-like domain-containing protein n=1 Tax=Oedothorax gibbosus TaxID=931172 RepID=A0AAV6V0R0_9ARAC|nr:hypothetical protein JTE90_021844 [Oedothorax gibbosus]
MYRTNPMQVTLQPLSQDDGSSVVVDTNSSTTISTLITSYCSRKGIAFDSKLVIFDSKKRPLPQFSTLSSLGISDGQKLLIGYKNTSFTYSERWPLLIALAALFIGVVGILVISLTYGLTGGKFPDDYGVVMDAGSSKTNTIVYKWKSNKHNGTGCVSQETDCFALGGIAKMDPMKLDEVIECAKNVTSHVDEKSRPQTPLYFAATAGMRLLDSVDPDRVKRILDQLRNQLNETGLSVKAIEIISGTDEGVYAWITANFLQETLEIPQKLDPWVPTTFGALDMGGASMQISYAIPDEDKRVSTDTKALTLYGQKHNVFAHSNLCFGRDEAEFRLRYLLLQDLKTAYTEDPCSPAGFKYNVSGEDLLKRPCTNSTRFPDLVTNPNNFLANYTFEGTSNVNECKKKVKSLLDNELCKLYNFVSCFKRLDNIPSTQEYLAFASYYYATDFLNVTKGTLKDFETASDAWCKKNSAEVNATSTNKYREKFCFNTNYVRECLINGFGFNNDTWKNIQFVSKVAGKDVGWSLGYMINATNLIPEKARTPKPMSKAALSVSLIIFILIVCGTIAFLIQQQRNKKRGYSEA